MQNVTSGTNPAAVAATVMATASDVAQNVTGKDNATEADGNCILLHFEEYIPWNNPDNLMSAEVEATTDRIKNTVVIPVLFLIGGPANVINMAVFWKQGLRERINLCLFFLSLADELYLIHCIVFNGERINTQFTSTERYGPVMKFMINHNLVGFYGFTWISQVMSAIIASERCFCVVSPLRSQHVLTTRTMGVIIAGVYVTLLGMYFLVASRYRVTCVLDPETGAIFNAVVGGEFYHQNKDFINFLDSVVYGVALPGVVMVIVVSTTIVTTVKLRQNAVWRASATTTSTTTNPNSNSTIASNTSFATAVQNIAISDRNVSVTTRDAGVADDSKRITGKASTTTMTSRELALTKMLIATSVLFIACVTPISLLRFVMLFLPELTAGGRQHNTFFFSVWILEIFSLINSSFNLVVYYTMGSRFRDTLKDMFCGNRRGRSHLGSQSCSGSRTRKEREREREREQ